MILQIGKRLIKDISKEELIELCMIEKVHAHLDYWGKPVITDFDNSMFSDTIVIDYHSLRIDDELKSSTLVFYFNHVDFSFHYRKEGLKESQGSSRLKIESIKYLISIGFNLPIY